MRVKSEKLTDIKANHSGFTLIELLVAIVVAGVVMAGVYSAYSSQQKAYLVQDQVAAMQQNLRVAMYMMEREIRMAGCDPTRGAAAGIITANANSIEFTMDITDDPGTGASDGDTNDPNEHITYVVYDSGGDGINDLGRDLNNGQGPRLTAENIDALDFVYLDKDGLQLDDDGLGNVTTSIAQIRSVQITLVARTGRGDLGFTNNDSYLNQQGATIYTAPGDVFRRKSLSVQVRCRNLGRLF